MSFALLALLMAPVASADPGALEPIEAWLSEDQPPPTAGHAHDLGVVVQLGPWLGSRSDEPACELTVLVPDGFALEGTPTLDLGEEGLHVDLALVRGTGGLAEFELVRCLPAATPVLLHLAP